MALVATTKRAARAREARFRAAHPYDRGSAEANEAARALLDPFYGATIVMDDPYARDAIEYASAWDDQPDRITCPAIVGIRNPRPCRHPQDHSGKHEPKRAEPTLPPDEKCNQWLHAQGGPRRCIRQPDYHDGPHEYEPVSRFASTPARSIAPVLAATVPLDVTPPTTDTSCPRCGQTFRKSGTGLSWHLANRLDCAERKENAA